MAELTWPAGVDPSDDWRRDALIDLAWASLAHRVRLLQHWNQHEYARSDVDGDLVRRLQALQPDHFAAREALWSWIEVGHALACVRAVAERRETWPRMLDEELEAFLKQALRPRGERAEAWKMLVERGVEPGEAWREIESFTSHTEALPWGQWIPSGLLEDLRPPADRRFIVLPDGTRVRAELARECLDIAVRQGRKIKAIKLWRSETGMGLRESKDAVEGLMDGTLSADGIAAGLEGLPTLEKRSEDRPRSRQRLDAAIDELIRDRPLFWVILATAIIRPDPKIPTMAVGVTEVGDVALFYSPKFVLRIGRENIKAVLVHEINHVLFGHLTPSPQDRLRRERRAWTVACEVTANEFVPYKLPGAPITLELVGLPPGESTLERYEKLVGREDLPGLVSEDRIVRALKEDPQGARDVSDQTGHYPIAVLRDAADLVGEEADQATADALGREGGMPGNLAQTLTAEGIEQLPWDELLKKMAAGLPTKFATRRYPNRRQPGQVGIIPGRRTRKHQPVVVAAIDTSGSMGNHELQLISAELVGLTSRNTQVVLVQCDTEVHEAVRVGKGFRLTRFKGRGGTDLRPPFGEAILRRFKPDLIVYFTDGYGPAPSAPPAGVEVLWILTGHNPRIPARWGKVCTMLARDRRSRVEPPP